MRMSRGDALHEEGRLGNYVWWREGRQPYQGSELCSRTEDIVDCTPDIKGGQPATCWMRSRACSRQREPWRHP